MDIYSQNCPASMIDLQKSISKLAKQEKFVIKKRITHAFDTFSQMNES